MDDHIVFVQQVKDICIVGMVGMLWDSKSSSYLIEPKGGWTVPVAACPLRRLTCIQSANSLSPQQTLHQRADVHSFRLRNAIYYEMFMIYQWPSARPSAIQSLFRLYLYKCRPAFSHSTCRGSDRPRKSHDHGKMETFDRQLSVSINDYVSFPFIYVQFDKV